MKQQIMELKKAMGQLEEADQDILRNLLKKLEKKQRFDPEEAEGYVDFLLGLAAEWDAVPEQAVYEIVEAIQEQE